ncbi:MAG: transcriptional repressor [Actinobacteria bacterium]|nr:transcriptional repressor [Actinomycetota bacterium]MDA3016900.1 transcriptional repressor [Actinomycetota bacterium]
MAKLHQHKKIVNLDVHLEVNRRFAQNNQRYSMKRQAIVTLLEKSNRPLTITEILQRSQNLKSNKNVIVQSSLYRNLLVLEEVGAVQRVFSTDDLSRYELNEEILGHHHHMLCSVCGDMRDMIIPQQLEEKINSTFAHLAKVSGFKLDKHRIDLVGRCKKCA